MASRPDSPASSLRRRDARTPLRVWRLQGRLVQAVVRALSGHGRRVAAEVVADALEQVSRTLDAAFAPLRATLAHNRAVDLKWSLLRDPAARALAVADLGGERALRLWERRASRLRRRKLELGWRLGRTPTLAEARAHYARTKTSAPVAPPVDTRPPRILHPDQHLRLLERRWNGGGRRTACGRFQLAPLPAFGSDRELHSSPTHLYPARPVAYPPGTGYEPCETEARFRAGLASERAAARAANRVANRAANRADGPSHPAITLTPAELRHGAALYAGTLRRARTRRVRLRRRTCERFHIHGFHNGNPVPRHRAPVALDPDVRAPPSAPNPHYRLHSRLTARLPTRAARVVPASLMRHSPCSASPDSARPLRQNETSRTGPMINTASHMAMSDFTTSERGLRLIKAFEGFRPVDRVLVTGTRVVGHGHRLTSDDAILMDRKEAHEVLLDDLAPFEDMINETVFAPLTQGQFDALVSLAFNIGPRAFLNSDVLRAVNAGRPLDAAAGFDVWRRADIAGQTFVVDALVRRRTAEKALFLRPGEGVKPARAPGSDLDPRVDPRVATDMGAPTLDRTAAGRLVADAPYDLSRLITDPPSNVSGNVSGKVSGTVSGADHMRRREDGPAGEMALTELAEETEARSGDLFADVPEDPFEDAGDTASESTVFSGLDTVLSAPEDPRTPIAKAADEVRDRLDALMDVEPPEGFAESPADAVSDADKLARVESLDPLDLITPAPPEGPVAGVEDDVLVQFPTRGARLTPPPGTKPGTKADLQDDLPAGATEWVGPHSGSATPRAPQGAGAFETADAPSTDTSFADTLSPGTLSPGTLSADTLSPDALSTDPSVATPSIDSLAADAALRDRSVSRTSRQGVPADWAPGELPQAERTSPLPYVLLFALGGALFGTGAMLLQRGRGLVMGQPPELVGMASALIGAMLILGGVFYLLKTTVTGDET